MTQTISVDGDLRVTVEAVGDYEDGLDTTHSIEYPVDWSDRQLIGKLREFEEIMAESGREVDNLDLWIHRHQ